MARLFFSIISGILGLLLAEKFVSGVTLEGNWQVLILAGGILGLLNFFLKPLLKLITLPLRILTLGLFTFVINMFLVWVADIFFPELAIKGLSALFWTALIIFGLSFFLNLYKQKKKNSATPQS